MGIKACYEAISNLNICLSEPSLNLKKIQKWIDEYSYLSNFSEIGKKDKIYRYKIEITKLINFFTSLLDIFSRSVSSLSFAEELDCYKTSLKLVCLDFLESMINSPTVKFGDDFIFYENYNIKLIGLKHILHHIY